MLALRRRRRATGSLVTAVTAPPNAWFGWSADKIVLLQYLQAQINYVCWLARCCNQLTVSILTPCFPEIPSPDPGLRPVLNHEGNLDGPIVTSVSVEVDYGTGSMFKTKKMSKLAFLGVTASVQQRNKSWWSTSRIENG